MLERRINSQRILMHGQAQGRILIIMSIYGYSMLIIMFLSANNMLIDLDNPHPNALNQLEKKLFVDAITFELTPDANLTLKLQKIDDFLPFINRFPTISTSFRLKQPNTHVPVFATVAVGGTFDHLHVGHQVLLLCTALSASRLVHIGITGQALLAKKKSREILEPWEIRMHRVQKFIKSVKPELQVNLFELNDPFGVTVQQPNIDALVISEQTLKGGEKVNEARAQRGMKSLQLILCPTISPSKDIDHKVSSTSIREYLLQKNWLTIEQYSEYRSLYDSLAGRMRASNREKIEEWWELLFLNYSQHWRHYHTNRHIYMMLQQWNSGKFADQKSKLSVADGLIVETAIFFHDIVYRPDSSTNQQDSAQLATAFLHDLLDGESFEREYVVNQSVLLILQTKKHEPSNGLSQILYDLDMGILNSEFKHYQEYARGIKRQYQPLVGEQYGFKRAQLVKGWKESKLHFSFSPSNMEYNLNWELFCLQNNDL